MAPLCKRALRYLGIIKKYVLPRKSIAVFSCILIASLTVVGFVVLPEPASAVGFLDSPGVYMVELIVSLILMIAKLFMQITVFFLSLFIAIAKYNDYINADIVILGWGMVRDVANMFFIVVLMVIAFATILGLESYAWKKTLGKFILMAILVNFSNLIFQVIIDMAQVFTLTFANAIAATAGGNLISIFNMDKFFSMSSSANPRDLSDVLSGALPAAVMAGIMAFIAMGTIASYCILMVVRLVVLWTMIILSPLVFILSILPQTKAQATDIWREFMNHVLAGPVMVFFLWLAFAAFGSGNAAEQLGMTTPEGGMGVSISEAASYDNLANFAVAIAFLLLGMERVQKLGLRGQTFADKAGKFVQQAAMWGTGVKYLQKEGTEAIKDWAKIGWGATGGRILDSAPIVGVGAKAGRKAIIAEQEKLRKTKEEVAAAKVRKGLGRFLAPSDKAMHLAEKEKQSAEEAQKSARADAEVHHKGGDEKAIKKRTKELAKDIMKEQQKAFDKTLKMSMFVDTTGLTAEDKTELGLRSSELAAISGATGHGTASDEAMQLLKNRDLASVVDDKTLGERQLKEMEKDSLWGAGKAVRFLGLGTGRKYNTLHAAAQKAQADGVGGKANSLEEIIGNYAGDAQLASNSKVRKKVMLYEAKEAREELEEFAELDMDKRQAMIKRLIAQKQKLAGSKKPEDKKALKQTNKALLSLLASTHDNGELSYSGSVLGSDWQAAINGGVVDFNDPAQNYLNDFALMGATVAEVTHGGSFDSPDAIEKQREFFQKMATGSGEKFGANMLAIKKARENDVQKNGAIASAGHVMEAVDENGALALGYAKLAEAGTFGKKGGYATGSSGKSGEAWRSGKYTFAAANTPANKIDSESWSLGANTAVTRGGAAVIVSGKQVYAMGALNTELASKLERMSASSLAALSDSQKRRLLGSASSTELSNKDGDIGAGGTIWVSSAVHAQIQRTFDNIEVAYGSSDPRGKDAIKQNMMNVLQGAGLKATEAKHLVDSFAAGGASNLMTAGFSQSTP